ncbi:MAG: hypothetical protein IT509_13605, partial [Rhodocyclaceae bacterium]|nr:hypothetical protein [Rhodocyclaceae bacterium]
EPTTALTVTARAALALSSDQTRKDLQELVKKSANIKEVKNVAGREECHSAAMVLVRARTTITKTGKAAREDAAAFQKAVIAEEKALIAITEAEEARLLALRDAWDAARAAEKAEAERIERLRVETIHLRIADIREAGNLALQCRTSAMVEALIDKLDGATLDGFDEFTEEAERARETTLARMKEIAATKLAEEQERARVKAEQEAEAARLALERAELERQRKEAAEQARIAAQERAEQEAKAKAAREADEAAAQAILDAEALRLADERAAFEAEQAAARAAAQAQADELARQRAEFDAELRRRAAEAEALQEAAKPLPAPELQPVIVATDTDIFNQEDGSDLLDGPMSPSDAEVIACAAAAVAQRFGWNFNDALNRLAEVQEWIVAETT